VRTVIRGISAIARQPVVLNPWALGFFAFQVWSHKLLRWLVPWFLLGLLGASLLLVGEHWFYKTAAALQAVFYLFVLLGALSPGLRRITLVRIPYYFIQANLAVAHATLAFLMGKRVTLWEPSKR
jgi:hypothetical protein